MKLLLAVVATLAALLAWTGAARAHETRAATLEVDATSGTTANVTLRAPPGADVSVEPPDGCRLEGASEPARGSRLSVLRCPDGLSGRTFEIGGSFKGASVVLVRMTGFGDTASTETSVATARSRRVALPGAASSRDVLSRYVRLGAEHVLSGLDHVLFLLALFWQAWAASRGAPRRAAWELARTATAFTVAHSVTLAATVLGWLRVPASAAEACIAGSLVLAALDVGDGEREAPKISPLGRAGLAAAFGLVHGLGFAGALAETRVAGDALPTALVAFNVGVEAGQALLFIACLGAMTAIGRLVPGRPAARWLGTASAYVIGATGAALFFLRTISIFRG